MKEFFISLAFLLGGILLGIVLLRGFYKSFLSSTQRLKREQKKFSLLKVTVFRDNEKGPLAMEQIFSAIHGLLEKISWWERLMGKEQDQVSFEIANIKNKIHFYVWVPKKYKSFVEGQMYAQYPEIEIDEVSDYVQFDSVQTSKIKGLETEPIQNIPDPNEKKLMLLTGESIQYAMGAELVLSGANIFPIKRYSQFEDKLARIAVDPLAGITAALGKVNDPQEQIWLQVVVQPTDDEWRKQGLRTMRIIKKLFSKWLFKNSFWLQGKAVYWYNLPDRWTRFWYAPLFFLLWVYRGGGGGIIVEDQTGDDDTIRDEVSRSHDRETSEGAIISKISILGFNVNIRMIYLPKEESMPAAEIKLRGIASSFKQFNQPQLNGFAIRTINAHNNQLLRRFKYRTIVNPFILNTEELATVYHFPNILVHTPNIQWVNSKRLEPPVDLPTPDTVPAGEFTLLGSSNYRGNKVDFGIKTVDRRRHVYIIGKTGMGKSTILENMVFSDIMGGKGLAVIDPHGDLADAVLNFTPKFRTNDVVVFDPSDRDYPVAFNMLECKIPDHRTLVASGLLGVFKKMYADSWGPRLEHILRNTLLALIEYPNTTMLGIMRILVDKSFRKKVVDNITDPVVRSFWVDEFEKMQDRQRTEAISPIQNKVGQFLSSPIIRNIVGQPKSSVDIRFAMDKKKIFVVNLSKGKIGEDNAALLGSMMITKFQLDAMSRADIPEKDRVDFYLYVDEFQNFATDSFATILSEARKYRLNLTMANQYIAQMSEEVSGAVFGNVGTLITFQVGYDDADYLSKQFSEEVLFNDIVCLPKYNIYTKLMVDGMPTKVFSASTFPSPEVEAEANRKEVVLKVSREKYASQRSAVEEKISRWSQSTLIPGKGDKAGKARRPEIKKAELKVPQLEKTKETGKHDPEKKVEHENSLGKKKEEKQEKEEVKPKNNPRPPFKKGNVKFKPIKPKIKTVNKNED